MLGVVVTCCLFFTAAMLSGVGVLGVFNTRQTLTKNTNCCWFATTGLLGIFLGVLGVCSSIAHEQAQQEIRDLREYIRRI